MTNPKCAQPGCASHERTDHDPAAGLHPCTVSGCTCPSWLLPHCSNSPECAHDAEKHELTDPHACTSAGCDCAAYVFSGGHQSSTYTGGGGGFGGGGATGGW